MDEQKPLLSAVGSTAINAEPGDVEGVQAGPKQSFARERKLVVVLANVVLVLIAVVITVAVLTNKPTLKANFSLDEVLNGTFAARRQSIRWIYQAGGVDGTATYQDDAGDIYVRTPPFTQADALLARQADIIDPSTGAAMNIYDYWISSDQSYILLATAYVKGWRHSFNATYWVYSVATKAVTSLVTPQHPLQLAQWAPVGTSIAYVDGNNLAVLVDLQSAVNVTTDGQFGIANGVPSWVYEEEVFGTNSAVWWSPDGQAIAFLRSDETLVDTFTYPIYGNAAYPKQMHVKYPKAGFPNPKVEIFVYSITDAVTAAVDFGTNDDEYIVDVAWVNTTGFLTRLVPRVQQQSTVYYVSILEPAAPTTLQVSQQFRPNGWIDYAQLLPIAGTEEQGGLYLDLINYNGYNHVALYSINSAQYVRVLTGSDQEQPYEVVQIAGFSQQVQRVFVLTTQYGPAEQHLYSVSISGGALQEVSPPGEGFYTTSFSTLGGYFLLTCEGPSVPTQSLLAADGSFNLTVEDNQALASKLRSYAVPLYEYFQLEANGQVFNAVMIKPQRFDAYAMGKHPVLLRVYGGPGSQLVQKKYLVDWHTYLVTSLDYIVVMMDARGTSGRGNDFKNAVYKHLGDYEAQDQLAMGAYLQSQRYVDMSKLYVWGWSYGGYLSSKIVEADVNHTFTGAIAVAPVTDWRLYDTIYTERYMLEPAQNVENYAMSAVKDLTNFANARYFLVHGTADDNVHYQHSAVFVSELVAAGVAFDMFAYTDNDHNINTGANTRHDLYSRLTHFLQNVSS